MKIQVFILIQKFAYSLMTICFLLVIFPSINGWAKPPSDYALVSASSEGQQANGNSFGPALSKNGRFVIFRSVASNLVNNDDNGAQDIFIHDIKTGLTKLVSQNSFGIIGNSDSGHTNDRERSSEHIISADGRLIVFHSWANNLVNGDKNDAQDVFIRDQKSGLTRRVSLSSKGEEANNDSTTASISADGRFVAFESLASNMVPIDNNGQPDIFVRDLNKNITVRASLNSKGEEANNESVSASISGNGRYVVFMSEATNLVASPDNNYDKPEIVGWDIFVRDLKTGVTTRVSENEKGEGSNWGSHSPSISYDGRYVAFVSYADNLVPGEEGPSPDIFVRDLQIGSVKRIVGQDAGSEPRISDNGRFILFLSGDGNLVPNDNNNAIDIFVHDSKTQTFYRVAEAPYCGEGELCSQEPIMAAISGNARVFAFMAGQQGDNWVPNDIGDEDIFVKRLLGNTK